MKITKKELREANQKLAGFNLELEVSLSGNVQCFCTTLRQEDEQLWNMNMINSEIRAAKTFSDIKWLSYFK